MNYAYVSLALLCLHSHGLYGGVNILKPGRIFANPNPRFERVYVLEPLAAINQGLILPTSTLKPRNTLVSCSKGNMW